MSEIRPQSKGFLRKWYEIGVKRQFVKYLKLTSKSKQFYKVILGKLEKFLKFIEKRIKCLKISKIFSRIFCLSNCLRKRNLSTSENNGFI